MQNRDVCMGNMFVCRQSLAGLLLGQSNELWLVLGSAIMNQSPGDAACCHLHLFILWDMPASISQVQDILQFVKVSSVNFTRCTPDSHACTQTCNANEVVPKEHMQVISSSPQNLAKDSHVHCSTHKPHKSLQNNSEHQAQQSFSWVPTGQRPLATHRLCSRCACLRQDTALLQPPLRLCTATGRLPQLGSCCPSQ